MKELEQLKIELDALERTVQVMAQYGYKDSFVLDLIKADISQKIEDARWSKIRLEIAGVANNLEKNPIHDQYIIQSSSMIAWIEYIRHLEKKAGVTNDRS